MKLRSVFLSIAVIIPFTSLASDLNSISSAEVAKDFFSLAEIKGAQEKALQALEYLAATDQTSLA